MAILVNTDYCDELLVENLIFVTGASVSPCVYIQSPSRFPQGLWMTCLISCLDRKVFMTGAYVALPFLFVSPVVVIYTRRFVIHCCIVFAVILGLCFFVVWRTASVHFYFPCVHHLVQHCQQAVVPGVL